MSLHKFGKDLSRHRAEKYLETALRNRPMSSLISDAYLATRVDDHIKQILENKFQEYIQPKIESLTSEKKEDKYFIQLWGNERDFFNCFLLPNGKDRFTVFTDGEVKILSLEPQNNKINVHINNSAINPNKFITVKKGDRLQFYATQKLKEDSSFYAEVILRTTTISNQILKQ